MAGLFIWLAVQSIVVVLQCTCAHVVLYSLCSILFVTGDAELGLPSDKYYGTEGVCEIQHVVGNCSFNNVTLYALRQIPVAILLYDVAVLQYLKSSLGAWANLIC